MGQLYQIIEYGSFIREQEIDGYTSLAGKTFDALESFILSNSNGDTNALELMGLSARKGIGRIITAKNYVGVITMKDGTTIEILPKIVSNQKETSAADTKRLLVKMLKTLRNSPYKSLQTTNVNIEKMSIFEIFIRMFIDEVFRIAKRGLKCNYETVESNESFYKGKMKFSQQIKYNYAHKERSYVEYDEFNTNRVENRLLKTTLLYVYKNSTSSHNKTDIKTLLHSFSDVDASTDFVSDFSMLSLDRNMKDYETALMWSRVFLQGKSFTSFAGSEVAFALLFPMETLFESYIAVQIRKSMWNDEFTVRIQDNRHHLFDYPDRKFLMKPDIVIEHIPSKSVFVMDTKWKILSERKTNYGISQSDMYQMYAYQKKYLAQNVTLLYPLTDKVSDQNPIEFKSEDDVFVRVMFIDLFDEYSINRVTAQIEEDKNLGKNNSTGV